VPLWRAVKSWKIWIQVPAQGPFPGRCRLAPRTLHPQWRSGTPAVTPATCLHSLVVRIAVTPRSERGLGKTGTILVFRSNSAICRSDQLGKARGLDSPLGWPKPFPHNGWAGLRPTLVRPAGSSAVAIATAEFVHRKFQPPRVAAVFGSATVFISTSLPTPRR